MKLLNLLKKEINEELKKIEESITKETVDKEPKNVEGKIPVQRGDVYYDPRIFSISTR